MGGWLLATLQAMSYPKVFFPVSNVNCCCTISTIVVRVDYFYGSSARSPSWYPELHRFYDAVSILAVLA